MSNVTECSSDWILYWKLWSQGQAMGLVCKAQMVVGLVVLLQFAYCRVIFLRFKDVDFLLSSLYGPPWFDLSQYDYRGPQILKLHTVYVSPDSFYFHRLRSKFSLQYLIFKALYIQDYYKRNRHFQRYAVSKPLA